MTDRGGLPPTSSSLALVMRGISKNFGATAALRQVDLELERGTVQALLGENGAGKSTLMKILSGAIQPDGGRMALEGAPYSPSNPLDGRRRGIAMIYQELNLAPHLSVEENLMLGRENHTWGFLRRVEMRRRVREALELVQHPEIEPEVPVGELSLAARQVVEIARALMERARILVMDEPTSSLSLEDTERLFLIIRRLAAEGVSLIYISHFLEEVQRVADSVTVLRDGQRTFSGRMDRVAVNDLIRLMVGQEVQQLFPRVDHALGDPVLVLSALKGRRMAAPVSFALRRGEILGLAGLIGAGRTETLRTLFGLDAVEAGGWTVFGRPPGRGGPARRIGQGLGFLSEDRQGEGLAVDQSLADNLTLSYFRPYHRAGILSLRRQRLAAQEWVARMNIKARSVLQPAGSLSGGNQQKIALARLLHQQADILLLDEPTRGIDVASKSQIYEWIGRLAKEGKSVIFVSSYFPELLGICDTVAIFHRGRIVDVRPAGDWDGPTLMAAAALGQVSPPGRAEERKG